MAEYSFKEPRFHDAEAARTYLEGIRWPNGPVCPHCGAFERISKIEGKSARPGLYQCLETECRQQFTVTVGTVFERSKISLDKWVFAATLMASSKKGISSKQIERMLGVTYKTAWFMTHRLREAMKHPASMFAPSGGTVEADETYVGGKEKNKHAHKRTKGNIGGTGKQMVFTLVHRETGQVRSFHLPSVNAKNLKPVLESQINCAITNFRTDGEGQYRILAPMFASHEAVNHGAGEYVRGDAHCNTAEGFFSILKRGIVGTFHFVSEQHLQRYVTEFDFRYNHRQVKRKIDGKTVLVGPTDIERTETLLKQVHGKRLTYRRTRGAEENSKTGAH
ncbi:MAG TPA: IS1595 family transposase [Burkholderiales bacterium]|nr:IS1595 family transposase [Burkholderiales bacterium]